MGLLKDIKEPEGFGKSLESVKEYYAKAQKKWDETDLNDGVRSEEELIGMVDENWEKPFDLRILIEASKTFD